MAAQFVFNGHFISKFSALSEFIEHLPTASDLGVIHKMKGSELIEEACSIFPASIRPHDFIDPNHCEECREHNDCLKAHTREDISYLELGNSGWDPICFVDEKGFEYYFPALVRLAINGKDNEYYIDQFLFHLTQNSSRLPFSPEQALFIVKVLEYLLENKAEEIESNMDDDELLNAIQLWNNE